MADVKLAALPKKKVTLPFMEIHFGEKEGFHKW
jgi:hypothetical protein